MTVTTNVSKTGVPGVQSSISAFFPGKPTASLLVLRLVMSLKVSLPALLTGSNVSAAVAATASTVFDLQRNGASIGSVTFAAAGTVATFTFTTKSTFVPGDIFSIVAPATPDATLSDISFAFLAIRE